MSIKINNFKDFGKEIINESVNESEYFYGKKWIEELSSEFGDTVIDKVETINPLYGGGNYVFVGYKINIDDDTEITELILEGIAINGLIVNPSIMIKTGGEYMYHGGLNVTYNFKDKLSVNMELITEQIKVKIKDFLGS